MNGPLLVTLVLAIFALIVIIKTAVVVPQQTVYIVERLGKYHGTLTAGFHLLVPFFDVIRYRHSESKKEITEQRRRKDNSHNFDTIDAGLLCRSHSCAQ
jgi:regulator of protease activity HflC (stomatin/prohibitin superfamily)